MRGVAATSKGRSGLEEGRAALNIAPDASTALARTYPCVRARRSSRWRLSPPSRQDNDNNTLGHRDQGMATVRIAA